MRPSDALSAPGGVPAWADTGVRPAARGGQATFSGLMREVDTEVRRFIAHGDGGLRGPGLTPEAAWQRLRLNATPAAAVDPAAIESSAALGHAQTAFLSRIAPWAGEAARTLGVAPELVAAHAALESGWGRQPLRHADGSETHNLFGIKATGAWHGAAVDARTTEYEEGVAHKTTERFRSYDSLGDAFGDYARLLRDNPRYRAALNAGSDAGAFAQGLARGGYATDPAYAEKLTRVARQIQGARP